MPGKAIIAVHVGAGSHSSSLQIQYKKLMKKACLEAADVLSKNGTALDAVCCATKILEDSPLTNAGIGSSLTMDGTVECDATVMEGKSFLHGSVGAVSGVTNPILLARRILEAQKHPLPGGLVSPSFLAGPGARAWAVSNDVPVCQAQNLITEKAQQIHSESLKYIRQLEEKNGKKMKLDSKADEDIKSGLLDTVGAVCVDHDGNVASAVSSGGILLKHSGRIGQAAIYGCGSWAQNNYENSNLNIAVSTSGCGEHLIRTTFGRLCAHSTYTTNPLGSKLADDIKEQFLDSVFLQGIDTPMGGSLSLRHDPKCGTTDLFWLHTTRTMGVAYMMADEKHPQTSFSTLPDDRVGKTVAINCKSFTSGTEPETETQETTLAAQGSSPSSSKEDESQSSSAT